MHCSSQRAGSCLSWWERVALLKFASYTLLSLVAALPGALLLMQYCIVLISCYCTALSLAASLHISKEQLQAASGFLELCIDAGQLGHDSPELVRTVKRCTRDYTCSSFIHSGKRLGTWIWPFLSYPEQLNSDGICNSCNIWNCSYPNIPYFAYFVSRLSLLNTQPAQIESNLI